MNNNKNIITLLILVLFLIGGSIYYFKNSDEPDISENDNNKKNPIVLSETSDTNNNIVLNNGNETNSDAITGGQQYLHEITKIRKDINDGFDDLNQKVKYKTLFDEQDTMASADSLLNQLDKAKLEIKNLKIDDKFSEANEMHVKSIDLLIETVEYFKQLYHAKTQEEQQKYSDLYNYNIDESNKILEDIVIPQ